MRLSVFADRIIWKWLCLVVVVILGSSPLQRSADGTDCPKAVELQEPYARANYLSLVESGRLPVTTDFCFSPPPADNSSGKIFDLITMDCISCHDGVLAKAVDFRFVRSYEQGQLSIRTISASHPIGVDYARISCSNKFNNWQRLPSEIVLMDGQLGCASCHNLLGSASPYLAIGIDRSRLCFVCHNK
jgi:predicted CXXCH cytochrome family protein